MNLFRFYYMNKYIYCAGGFGREVYDIVIRENSVKCRSQHVFFIDDFLLAGSEFYGTKILSFSEMLFNINSDDEVIIANGEPENRRILWEKNKACNVKFGKVIDPSAIVVDSAIINPGCIITAHVIVASNARISENVVVNVSSIIGHDVQVDAHSVISSMVNLGGGVHIGAGCYIGMGVQIKEGVSVGDGTIIGMGSIVFNDIPPGLIALGNPARPMRPNIDKRVFGKH